MTVTTPLVPDAFLPSDEDAPQPRETVWHVHETVRTPPTCNAKIEKNSRGVNYEVTVVGARSPEELDALLRDVRNRVQAVVDGEVAEAV